MSDEQIKTDPDIVERLRSGYIIHTMTEAADEIVRLRALITAWADADDILPFDADAYGDWVKAGNALREAVGR